MRESLKKVKESALKMSCLSSEEKNRALLACADLLIEKSDFILAENAKDLEEQKGQISSSLYQRLAMTESKVSTLAQGIRDLAAMKDPCGKTLLKRKLDEGLILEQVTVPIGVIGIIFESRPDAVPQILSLVLKSGNAAILKGGKEAYHSCRALLEVFKELRERCPFLPETWMFLLESREDVGEMLKQEDLIDLVIPRGSMQLVRTVMDSTKIPVLGHADGICHVFVEESADLEKALNVIVDSKAQYPSACNALETLLIQESVFDEFYPNLKRVCADNNIEIVEESDVTNWSFEYGEPKMSVKKVKDISEAIEHINKYGSHHTDTVLTTNDSLADQFLAAVDSSSVMVNASTRFADGFRYGMGAEVGISTAKTHARGPVGIEGLIIYKYILRGENQTVAEYASGKSFIHEDLFPI